MRDAAAESAPGLAETILTLIDPESRPRLDNEKPAHLYSLTNSETPVCGLTGRAIAEDQVTSPDTVKEQMSAVFAATSVGRR